MRAGTACQAAAPNCEERIRARRCRRLARILDLSETPRMKLPAVIMAAAALFAQATPAALVIDQQNEEHASFFPLGLGGEEHRLVAQVVTAGRSGELRQVRLDLDCVPGTGVELQVQGLQDGVPDGNVLDRTLLAAESLTRGANSFPLRGTWFNAGDSFALVLRAVGGTGCHVGNAGSGHDYPGGNAHYTNEAYLPHWYWLNNSIRFATFVEDGVRDPHCRVAALGQPIEGVSVDAPICRCLADASLANFRCSLRLPEFELAVEVPRWPDKQFDLRWSVLPLVDAAPALAVEVDSRSGQLEGEALLIPAKATAIKPLQPVTRHQGSPGAGAALGFKLQVGEASYLMETVDPAAK
jgi:hypothetical protein